MTTTTTTTTESSEDESVTGPMPIEAQAKDDEMTARKTRKIGPSLPPATSEFRDRHEHHPSSSDNDDDFGPALPSDHETKPVPVVADTGTAAPSSSIQPKTQRDSWMTVAPSSGDWSSRVDPTKLKSRKFNTSKSTTVKTRDSDLWHETPAQKQARLQEESLGLRKLDKPATAPRSPTVMNSEDNVETARRIREYNASRGPSLYSAHQQKQGVEGDDDPSARAFDREKDIGGGVLNAAKRRDIVKKSSDFNSRFSSAKYL